MKQKWLLTGTALALAASLAGCGSTAPADNQAQSNQPQASYISMDQAQAAALDAANIDAANADVSSATLGEIAGITCYKVEFTSGDYAYSYSINAESGEVLEMSSREQTVATLVPEDGTQTDTPATNSSGSATTPAQAKPSTNPSTGAVSEAKAQEIALAHAGVKAADATITKSKLDYDDGRQVYEIEWYANGAKYDYEIDVATGEVVKSDYEAKNIVGTGNSATINEADAKKPSLPVCLARPPAIFTSGSSTTMMATRNTRAKLSMAALSTNSPLMQPPAPSPNGMSK